MKIYLFLIAVIMMITACTPEEEYDLYNVDYPNNTTYRSYHHPDNDLVNVHARYSAKVHKNGVLIGDTSYTNNALYFKKFNSSVWQFIKSFGKDSLAVVYRSKDTALVRYGDSLIYRIVFANAVPAVCDTISGILQDSTYHDFDPSSSQAEIRKIDSINTKNNYYLTYPKWQTAIKNRFL